MTPSLTKRDIVLRACAETDQNQEQVRLIVQHLLDAIHEGLTLGMPVELRDFGVFEIQLRKARIGRNPRAPEKGDVIISARAVVKFTPGKELRAQVLKLTPPTAL